MSYHFVREIQRLNRHLIQFGDVVEESVQRSFQAVLGLDEVAARGVIGDDREIDQREVELEEECLKLLALHQPVAADLRLIVAVLKINNDLERIGDHAVNIAERALDLAALAPLAVPDRLHELNRHARLMLRKSLLALVESDYDLALAVIHTDDRVDKLNRQIFRDAVEAIGQQPQLAEQHLLLLSVVRQLERIGDHASNIAEDVIYMLTGDIVRHEGMLAHAVPRTSGR